MYYRRLQEHVQLRQAAATALPVRSTPRPGNSPWRHLARPGHGASAEQELRAGPETGRHVQRSLFRPGV